MNTGVEDGVSVKGSHRNLRKIVRTDANGNQLNSRGSPIDS